MLTILNITAAWVRVSRTALLLLCKVWFVGLEPLHSLILPDNYNRSRKYRATKVTPSIKPILPRIRPAHAIFLFSLFNPIILKTMAGIEAMMPKTGKREKMPKTKPIVANMFFFRISLYRFLFWINCRF